MERIKGAVPYIASVPLIGPLRQCCCRYIPENIGILAAWERLLTFTREPERVYKDFLQFKKLSMKFSNGIEYITYNIKENEINRLLNLAIMNKM